VAVTPDSNQIISGSWDSTLKVWDLKTGKGLFTLKGHSLPITSVAAIPDSHRVISGSCDGTLKVWDLKTEEELFTPTLKGYKCADLLKRILSNPRIPFLFRFLFRVVWLIFTFLMIGWVNAVVVTPDGKQVISALGGFFSFFRGSNLKGWDLETREELFSLKAHTGWVNTLAVTPNGERLIAGFFSFFRDSNPQIFNLETVEKLFTAIYHIYPVTSVVVTPDNKRLVSSSWDNTL
jgi:WD40 repeat protein